jgi:hypothetical protein
MLASAEKWRKDFKVDEIVKFVLSFSRANGCLIFATPQKL